MLDSYPIFVVHYTPLKERKAALSAQLAREELLERATWLEEFDREQIREWPELDLPDNQLKKGPIAVNIAHAEALRRISQGDAPAGLILEDDAILSPGFAARIREWSVELPPSWDMLFVGDGCGFHIPWWRRPPWKRGPHVYPKENHKTRWGGDGATRCADSYFVSRAGAAALLQAHSMTRPFRENIDWALNRAIREMKLRVFWLEPTLATQGSQQGAYAGASYH